MMLDKNNNASRESLNIVANKNLDHLTAEIVHEIRNPLTTVKGFLQLIKPYLKEIGKEEYAEVALSELNRAQQLIYDYLNETKSNTIQKTSLNKVIKELALLYESETFLKNIQLTAILSNQDAVLSIPESQLKQVLMNIINNAIEAIDESRILNRKIQISTHIDTKAASIKITDTCGGITDETKNNLFIPYNSSKESGTGIGLCICKKIIEDHKGTIQVESILGKLTTFTISFPFQYFSIL